MLDASPRVTRSKRARNTLGYRALSAFSLRILTPLMHWDCLQDDLIFDSYDLTRLNGFDVCKAGGHMGQQIP
jgi:hypothetical protein